MSIASLINDVHRACPELWNKHLPGGLPHPHLIAGSVSTLEGCSTETRIQYRVSEASVDRSRKLHE
jgi:hypothetical protein